MIKKLIISFFAIMICIISYGRVVSTLLSARQMMNANAQTKYTAKDYVQDGLVAMLDGSDGLSEDGWTDLVSGRVCPLGGSMIVGNHIEITDSTGFSMAPLELEKMYSGDGCAEIDVDISGMKGNVMFFGVGANRFYLYCWGPSMVFSQIYGSGGGTFVRKQYQTTYAVNFNDSTKSAEIYEDGVLKMTTLGSMEKGLWFNYLRMIFLGSKIRGIRVYNRMLSQDEIVNNSKVSARMGW